VDQAIHGSVLSIRRVLQCECELEACHPKNRKKVAMFQQQIRRSGDNLVVTLPKEEVERLGFYEGQLVTIEVTPLETRPKLPPELQEIIDREGEAMQPALRWLAER
jgi:antitoxin component of MazEF toxin-antitoxin module